MLKEAKGLTGLMMVISWIGTVLGFVCELIVNYYIADDIVSCLGLSLLLTDVWIGGKLV